LLLVEIEAFVAGGDDNDNVRSLGQRLIENDMTLLDSTVNDSRDVSDPSMG
jgi:hypothetical protein